MQQWQGRQQRLRPRTSDGAWAGIAIAGMCTFLLMLYLLSDQHKDEETYNDNLDGMGEM